MATTPPFDQTETLAHELALRHGLTWKEQVHVEAALNALFYAMGIDEAEMPGFVVSLREFLDDILDNLYKN